MAGGGGQAFVPTLLLFLLDNDLCDFFIGLGHGLEYKIGTIKFFAHPFDYLCCHGSSSAGGNGMKLPKTYNIKHKIRLISHSADYRFTDKLQLDLHQIGGFNYFPLQSCWAKSSMRCTTF